MSTDPATGIGAGAVRHNTLRYEVLPLGRSRRPPVPSVRRPLPIGAFVSSLIFDILTWTRVDGLPYLVDGAFWLIGVGLVGALIAAGFGILDLRAIPRGTRPFGIGLTHLMVNAGAAVLF